MDDLLRKFIEWSKLKFKIHTSPDIDFYFREREIWWASIGQNIGSEQNGKNKDFERPVLILKKFNHKTFLAVPVSSKLGISPYHHTFSLDDKQYSANLSQIRTLSSKRLLRRIDKMLPEDFDKIAAILKNLA